jgi:hypothetical protein
MDPWLKWSAFIVGVWLTDRALCWIERRGWIYWRGTAPSAPEMSPPLAVCKDCGYRVSTRAPTCPSCGRVLRPWILVAAVFLIAFLAVWLWRIIETLQRSF